MKGDTKSLDYSFCKAASNPKPNPRDPNKVKGFQSSEFKDLGFRKFRI